MEKLIERINELSRKNKTEGLNESELAEREVLRRQYIESFKRNFRQQLDQIEFTDEKPAVRH